MTDPADDFGAPAQPEPPTEENIVRADADDSVVSGEMVRRGLQMLRAELAMHPRSFVLAVTGAAVFAIATVAQSFVLGRIVDRVVLPRFDQGHVGSGAVIGAVVALVMVGAARAGGVVFRRYHATRCAQGVAATLRTQVVEQYQGQPLAWHQSHPTGELLSHAQSDAEAASDVLGPLPYGTGVVILILVAAAWLLATDVVLGVIALVLFPAITVLNVLYQRHVEAPAERAQSHLGDVSSVVHESFDGFIVVKALGAEDAEAQRFAGAAGRLRDAKVQVATMRASFDAALDAVPSMATVALVAVGAWRVDRGAVTTGQIVSFVSLFTLMVWPLRLIGFVLGELPRSVAGWDRVQRVLAEPLPERSVPAVIGHDRLPEGALAVDLDEVVFQYEPGRPVLRGVELHVEPGRLVAVVGPTGSGKSTLLSVIDRLLEPSGGSVRLGGHRLAEVAPDALAGAVAVAFQEPFLFSGSLRDNVDLGGILDDAAVAEAGAIAQIDAFIDDLPRGWDTVVGERGVTLSGGQRQRIALARALARQPRLLLLDDATSSVDPTTEARISTALARNRAAMTTMMVATRPSTIALADEVVFVDQGRVLAHGPHEQLLESVPAYRRLVEAYARERQEAG